MKIIIPMSGLGSRFIKAGYKEIKPLIKVNGKPIIEWVTKMFPANSEFIFICRNEHLKNTQLKEVLINLNLDSRIIGIDGHKKGPVYAVSKVFDLIKDDEPIIVSYCDFYMHWDFEDFINEVEKNQCDGAVPCYTGFHPHLLPKENLYAGCRIDANNRLLEIKEKFSFEENKINGFHSPGIYYFKNGAFVKSYFQKMLDVDLTLSGEFYVSLVYKLMLDDDKDLFVYDKISHFCQWGTPQDLNNYLYWTKEIIGDYP